MIDIIQNVPIEEPSQNGSRFHGTNSNSDIQIHQMNYRSGVYVIKCNRYYKIGCTSDIKQRMTELQVGNPIKLKLKLFHSANRKRAKQIEKELHELLSRRKLNGEWFELGEQHLAIIKHHFDKYCRHAPEIRFTNFADNLNDFYNFLDEMCVNK